MSDEYTAIDIAKCPKCGNRHRYRLQVERSTVLKSLTASELNERPRSLQVTRIFTCPVRDEEFQGTLTLKDTSSDRIKSVTVLGTAENDG